MDVTQPLLAYKYKRLVTPESIRILVLHSAETFFAPLICDLVDDNRSEILADPTAKRCYETVSYAWGEPNFSHELLCGNATSAVKITQNVDSMLRHLRKSAKPRRLWIDAICLNQDDHEEKREQVHLMGDIYRQGNKVHVWLGEADRWSDSILAFLRQIGGMLEDEIEDSLFRNTACLNAEQNELSPVEEFLHRPWFHRRWVIQEVALSDNVIIRCGTARIRWLRLKKALTILKSSLRLDRRAIAAIDTALEIRAGDEDIFDLLFRFSGTQCTDHRDRIAALYGLVNRSTMEFMWKVEYGASWIDNYRDLVRVAVDAGYTPIILYHLLCFGSLSSTESLLPGWVPDWRRQKRNRPFIMEKSVLRDSKDLASVKIFKHLRRPYDSLFSISGYEAGQIFKISNPPYDIHTLKKEVNYWSCRGKYPSKIIDLLMKTFYDPGYTDEAVIDRIYMSSNTRLREQKTFETVPSYISPKYQNCVDTIDTLLAGRSLRTDLPIDTNALFCELINVLNSHRLFQFGDDCFGIGPSDVQPSDLLIEYPGLHFTRGIDISLFWTHQRVALIFRESGMLPDGTTKVYRLVGDCYIMYLGRTRFSSTYWIQ